MQLDTQSPHKTTKQNKANALVIALASMHLAGAALADVVVLAITDETATLKSSVSLPDADGVAGMGVSGRLCVVNTQAGRGVHLTFTPAGGVAGDGKSWLARSPTTGAVSAYRQSISYSDGTGRRLLSSSTPGVVDVPASQVVSSTALCPGGGNLIKWVTVSALPTSEIFSDTVTITAASL